MSVVLIDSPVANVANIARALRAAEADLVLSSDASTIASAQRLVLPGVGSFAAAMRWLREREIDAAIHEAVRRGAALLGICVGHQLLFEESLEMGTTRGLAILEGVVRRLESTLPVPQIGWNRVRHENSSLFDGIPDGTPFYFVNSYAAAGGSAEVATAAYGATFTAAAQKGRVYGVQFHPEKSSTAGLQVLRNFVRLAA